MRWTFKVFLFFSLILGMAEPAKSYDFYSAARKKQDEKDAKRWSLSEWLEQKKKIKLMDSWLMFNAPSPYEFFLSADTSSLNQTVDNIENTQTFKNYRGAFGAFVTIVGLYGEYESSDEELEQWKALFMLRLMGSSDQSTNLTVHYGLMNQDLNNDPTQYQVGGARLNFYLIRAFALTGHYEQIFKSTSENGVESEGSRVEGGAHIEYGALRIYGSWYQETMNILTPTQSKRSREGVLFGLRLYF